MAYCTKVSSILQYLTPTITDKPEKVQGLAAKYYTIRTDANIVRIILYVYCNLQGINISMDRYFTSVSLSTWALEKYITIVGTMKHDLKGIPKELKPAPDREEDLSYMFITQNRKSFLFPTLIKGKMVRRM